MTRPVPPLTPDQAGALTLDTEPYLSCDDCFDLVDGWVEAVLSGQGGEPHGMREHLTGCAACREEAESLLALAREI
jgi:hypothetical protein